jgi:hypothetical protein
MGAQPGAEQQGPGQGAGQPQTQSGMNPPGPGGMGQ